MSTPSDITNFSFTNGVVRAFDSFVSVSILSSSGNKYACYNIKGVQKDSAWFINSSFAGDQTGFTFSMTSTGQVQYTSTDISGYTSSVVTFRATTSSLV